MQKFKNWMTTRMMPTFAKISTQRHLLAIRNGIVQILPFVIAGSIAMIITSFPVGSGAGDDLKSLMPQRVADWLYWMYKWNFTILGLIAGIAIGSELAKSYRLNSTVGATLGAVSLLIWVVPANIDGVGKVMPITAMDASAMLGAIVGSIISVEIYRIIVKYNVTIKLPKEVPPQITQAFIAIIPIFLITTIYSAIRHLIGFDLTLFISNTLEPIGNFVSGNVGGALLINFLITFVWWFGINMSGMFNAMVRPFWLQGLEQNVKIHEGTEKGDYKVFVEQFNQSFTQAGGAGASLGMVIAILIFAKAKGNRSVGWIALTPALFNINEPLIFGYPIMLNPYFFIPFILTPLINAVIAWQLVELFNVHFIASAPWTLPTPIFALLASGIQWQALLIAIICIGISTAIYIPFVIIHDKAIRLEENKKQEPKMAIA